MENTTNFSKHYVDKRINFIIPMILLVIFSCTGQELSKPNILWISAKVIGPASGCYGYNYAPTSNIDALVDEDFIFTNLYLTTPICTPSSSAMITGFHANSAGTQHLRHIIRIHYYLKTMPEILKGAGYYCTNNSKTDYNFDTGLHVHLIRYVPKKYRNQFDKKTGKTIRC